MPALEIRTCLGCKQEFKQCNYRQRICKNCRPNKKAILRLLRYGVTEEDVNKMIEAQGGHCALCPKPAIHVDHDHKTNEVRGVLCPACNTALNRIEYIEGWDERAHEYLQKG